MAPSFLRIAVSLPVRGTFHYTVPEDLRSRARVGCRVLVPFQNRKVIGYVLGNGAPQSLKNVKSILEVYDAEPLFHASMVGFLEWMADYYLHPIGKVIQSALPGGLNRQPYTAARVTDRGLEILKSLPDHVEGKKLLLWLKDHAGEKPPWPLQGLKDMVRRGWVLLEEQPGRDRTGPLLRKFIELQPGISRESVREAASGTTANNEGPFLETFLHGDAVLLQALTKAFTNGEYLVRKWIKKGLLQRVERTVFRDPAGKMIFPSPIPRVLYEQQKEVLGHIKPWLDRSAFAVCLLHGVTGSGKTEVYYRAVVQLMDSGRQSIVLTPEISLAVYLGSVFRSRLGDRVALYHSGLTPGERYDQWMRMVRGEVDMVVGARSALFAPFPRLGMIIVDEEHDSAYKQENPPRYHARDAAVVRAKMERVPVILGSGTPSVQSYQNAVSGKYHLLRMPRRIENRPPPVVDIVDLKGEDDAAYQEDMLSPPLKEALAQNLLAGNQALLFLNRRGFHRLFICRACGKGVRCPNCDVSLTYHLKEKQLSCHYCGFHVDPTMTCPSCGRETLSSYGFGTERLEHELKSLFPEARVGRMDTDTTRRKGEIFRILKQFTAHELDILVGTQMITKGYDFPKVTLVGVISADLSLGLPDFRAGEQTFQLLSQVAGRAGRGPQEGRVIIQTFNPEHYAIRTAMSHDYAAFFEMEGSLRRQLEYPPFSHLICLRLKGNHEGRTAEAARLMASQLRGILENWPKRGTHIRVLGPVEAPISRLKGKYRWQILIKSSRGALMRHLLIRMEKGSKKMLQPMGVQLVIDVDPYRMI